MRNRTFPLLRLLLMIAAGGLLCFVLRAVAAPPADGYSVGTKIPGAGHGRFCYLIVDEGARRLYLSHGTQVEVLDVDSGSIVGKIPNTPGVHGIAIDAEIGRGFVSNGKSNNVTVLDWK